MTTAGDKRRSEVPGSLGALSGTGRIHVQTCRRIPETAVRSRFLVEEEAGPGRTDPKAQRGCSGPRITTCHSVGGRRVGRDRGPPSDTQSFARTGTWGLRGPVAKRQNTIFLLLSASPVLTNPCSNHVSVSGSALHENNLSCFSKCLRQRRRAATLPSRDLGSGRETAWPCSAPVT